MLEFQDRFVEEARELIDGIESELIELESNQDNKSAIDEIFRVMHTLKGTASMFGFNSIELITHQLETIYDLIRDNKLKLSKHIINTTFNTVDIIKKILDTKDKLAKPEQEIFDDVLEEIYHISGTQEEKFVLSANDNAEVADKKHKSFYIFYKPREDVYYRGIKPFSVFEELSEAGKYKAIPDLSRIPNLKVFDPNKFYIQWDILLISRYSVDEIQDVFLFYEDDEVFIHQFDINELANNEFITNPPERLDSVQIKSIVNNLLKENDIEIEYKSFDAVNTQKEEAGNNPEPNSILKKSKDIFKKNSTLRVSADKLDHLITNVSEFVILYSQISLHAKFSENKELNKSIQALGKLSKKLRDNALELRLVTINELGIKLHRLIRDLSQKLNKEVDFITEGADTELDKTIIDNLEEPLMHIIRNSIDHGIEDKETRLKMNKSVKGVIRLTAFYSGTYVFIQIQDDGKGINPKAIKQKAVEKKLITADAQLTNRELYEFILLPGFSTAENISKISGRGVGMDVVKQKINELRGEIEIDSEINLGTSVTIKLPLTLSIIDTLKVKIENFVYLLPLSTVETCIRVKYHSLVNNVKKQYEYKNKLLPLIVLRDEFDVNNNLPENGKIVIIKQYEKKYCLLVDQVLGDHQAVVKPMGDLHKKHEYFSGVSVMGDGSLALILDTSKILTINKEVHN